MKNIKEKRKEEIVDVCFKIIHLWLENPTRSLSWVLEEIKNDLKDVL